MAGRVRPLLFLNPVRVQQTWDELASQRMVPWAPYCKQVVAPHPARLLTPTRSGYTPALKKEAFQLSTSSCVSQANSSCR